MKDGRLNKCAVCVKKSVDSWREANPDCRAKEWARHREKTGGRNREQYYKDRFPTPIGRKTSSLKYSHKRRMQLLGMGMSDFDEFVLEEASGLIALRKTATGIDWHIDHIVPINHKDACGLNSYHNLQVVPAVWNVKKGNRNMNKFWDITGY